MFCEYVNIDDKKKSPFVIWYVLWMATTWNIKCQLAMQQKNYQLKFCIYALYFRTTVLWTN